MLSLCFWLTQGRSQSQSVSKLAASQSQQDQEVNQGSGADPGLHTRPWTLSAWRQILALPGCNTGRQCRQRGTGARLAADPELKESRSRLQLSWLGHRWNGRKSTQKPRGSGRGNAMQCNAIPPEMQIMNMCSPQKKGLISYLVIQWGPWLRD